MNATRLASAALCLVLSPWTTPAAATPPPPVAPAPRAALLDLEVQADPDLASDTTSHIGVRLVAATDLLDFTPTAGRLTVTLARGDTERWPLFDGPIAASAALTAVPIRLPRVAPGSYRLLLHAAADAGETDAVVPISLRQHAVLEARTDKPVYRPGDTVRWRVAWLHGVTSTPVARHDVDVRITDHRGTPIWRGVVPTDDHGLAAGELPLGDDLGLGTYLLTAKAGERAQTRAFDVRPAERPAFFVTITAEERGSAARGEVHARYPYGEPVRGRVVVRDEGDDGATREVASGELDDDGTYRFTAPLPAPGRRLGATVTDGAGRRQTDVAAVQRASAGLVLALVPAQPYAVGGAPLELTAILTDADGTPQPAAVEVTLTADREPAVNQAQSLGSGVGRIALAVPRTRTQTHTSWHGEVASLAVTGPDDAALAPLRDALITAINRVADRAVTCGADGPGRLELTLERSRHTWRIVNAVHLPFADRPEFEVATTPSARACIERALAPVFAAHAGGGRAPISVSTTLERTRREDDERQPIRRVTATAVATTSDGRRAETRIDLPVRDAAAADAFTLRVADPVVAAGGAITVSGTRPGGAATWATATLLVHDVALASTPVVWDGAHFTATLRAPSGAYGLAAVRIDVVGWEPPGRLAQGHAAASVFIRPARLDVALTLPERPRPGADLAVDIAVTDEDGAPVAGAGLAVSVVDERALALGERQKNLQDALLDPELAAIGQRGALFGRLLAQSRPGADERAVMGALIESVPIAPSATMVDVPAARRFADELEVGRRLSASLVPLLARRDDAVVVVIAGATTIAPEPAELLPTPTPKGGPALEDPWGRPRTWAYLAALGPQLGPDALGAQVTRERLALLATTIARAGAKTRRALRKRGAWSAPDLAGHHTLDAWGRAVRLERTSREAVLVARSAGADGTFDTSDDVVHDDVFGEATRYGYGYGYAGVGFSGSGTGAMGSLQGAARVTVGRGEMASAAAVRERFEETALWVVGEETGADGRARFGFRAPDSVTGWEVEVAAIADNGATGRAVGRFDTVLPVHTDLRLPERLSVGDRVEASVILANHRPTAARLSLDVRATGAVALGALGASVVDLPPGTTRAVALPLEARETGEATLEVRVQDGDGREVDAMRKKLDVAARGLEERLVVPVRVAAGKARLALEIPADADPASVSGRLRAYRGPADLALDGVEAMLREPTGCFEQASSTTYPNLLVLRLLQHGGEGRAADVGRARELVAKGYQRLIGYEVPSGGFSWFGQPPASTVLTAYGLVEFTDMASVYPVDPALIARTRQWLIAQQARDGSFTAVGTWHGSATALEATAYIAYALSEAGHADKAARRAIAWVERALRGADKPSTYVLALLAAAEARLDGRPGPALVRLLGAQRRDGDAAFYPTRGATAFASTGPAADVEATALASTAARLGGSAGDADAALDWLWEARSPSYGWGTTQATVLALRAAVLGTEEPAEAPVAPLLARVDGGPAVELSLTDAGVPTLELALTPGKHVVTLEGAASGLRAELRAAWRRTVEPRAESRGLVVHLEAVGGPTRVGALAAMKVGVLNAEAEAVAAPTVLLPVPPGFAPDRASLEALVGTRGVSRYEDLGDRVALYLDGLDPGAAVVMDYQLEATTPADVLQRPAVAYAYYDPSKRGSSEPVRLVAVR